MSIRSGQLILPDKFVLHAAVESEPSEESENLVQYLVDNHPECIEVRSETGQNPLSLAFSNHRLGFARALIKAGANQTTRDCQGRNLLHCLLESLEYQDCKGPEDITSFINLLDQQLISSMLVEREGEDSRTPLMQWLDSVPTIERSDLHYKAQDGSGSSILTVLLDLGISNDQKHLEMLDGTGNTPLHFAVRFGLPQALELMLDRRPDLLYRENATGSTPLEMAVDAWLNSQLRTNLPNALMWNGPYPQWQNAPDRSTISYCPEYEFRTMEQIMYHVCSEYSQKHPGKRRLVSLFDANEVAKRLAASRE